MRSWRRGDRGVLDRRGGAAVGDGADDDLPVVAVAIESFRERFQTQIENPRSGDAEADFRALVDSLCRESARLLQAGIAQGQFREDLEEKTPGIGNSGRRSASSCARATRS
jgi:hypothetical protein